MTMNPLSYISLCYLNVPPAFSPIIKSVFKQTDFNVYYEKKTQKIVDESAFIEIKGFCQQHILLV